jgi:hypothetical protein
MAGLAPAYATSSLTPTLQLEEKLAYQKGQFGALYARCGSHDEKVVIGGSLSTWKEETFRGYAGTPAELRKIEAAFDQAATDVNNQQNACEDWVKQAAVTWHGIARLSEYGLPVASN